MPLVSASQITQTAGGQDLYAVAGSSGSTGVSQLIAGTNVTLSPPDGLGVVTVNASGGGGGVASVTGTGNGIIVNTVGDAVTVQNSGVTMLTAGTGISLNGSTGNLTVSASQTTGATFGPITTPPGRWLQMLNIDSGTSLPANRATLDIWTTTTSTFGTVLTGQFTTTDPTSVGIVFDLTPNLTALGIAGLNTAITNNANPYGCFLIYGSVSSSQNNINMQWNTTTTGKLLMIIQPPFGGTIAGSYVTPYSFSALYPSPTATLPPPPPHP